MNKLLLWGGLAVVLLVVGSIFLLRSESDPAISTITPRPTPPTGVKIVAFGDSLTAGYGVSQNEAYPAQLSQTLKSAGYEVNVINAGVSGETTRGNFERAPFIRDQKPTVVILGIGGNDLLRMLPIEETRKNISATIDILKKAEPAPVIILLQMRAPLNVGRDYQSKFDAIYVDLAKEKELVLVPFITPELFLDTANKLPDGIHYNAEGYRRVIEKHLLPVMKKVLDQLGQS